MSVDIRRAADRFRTESEWLDSRHAFSFGPYYDPANVGFGLLLVHNDEVVAPGTGFDTTTRSGPLHVEDAAEAARLAVRIGPRGIYNIAEDDGTVSIDKAKRLLGWRPKHGV